MSSLTQPKIFMFATSAMPKAQIYDAKAHAAHAGLSHQDLVASMRTHEFREMMFTDLHSLSGLKIPVFLHHDNGFSKLALAARFLKQNLVSSRHIRGLQDRSLTIFCSQFQDLQYDPLIFQSLLLLMGQLKGSDLSDQYKSNLAGNLRVVLRFAGVPKQRSLLSRLF